MITTAAAAAQHIGREIDDALLLQGASIAFLAAIARGEIDLNALAREELAARGMDHNATWVGFAAARRVCG